MSWENILKRKIDGLRVDHLPNDDYDAIRETLLEDGKVTVYSNTYGEDFPDALRAHIEEEGDSVFKLPETSGKIANAIVSPLKKDKMWGSSGYTYRISGSSNDYSSWFIIRVDKPAKLPSSFMDMDPNYDPDEIHRLAFNPDTGEYA